MRTARWSFSREALLCSMGLAVRQQREQDRIMAFLAMPSSYPHGPREVRSIQTHISWVFIASPFVFKVKKPVNLGFLDFSTLENDITFAGASLS